MPLSLQPWNSLVEARARAFLEERYATSMFLLGNLAEHGPRLGEHPSTGNFHVLLDGDRVAAVFSLLRRGNLLVSGDAEAGAAALILEQAAREGLPIKGVLGSWELAESVWNGLRSPTCSFRSREILYRLEEIPPGEPVVGVRFLKESDFAEWRPIRAAYLAEEGIVHDLPEGQLRANFARYCEMEEYWGQFEAGRLIATAALNARVLGIGQVGGVYTVPTHRGQGISQRVMRQLLRDCALVHGLRRMILFTGETNAPAQRVYEKCGFRRIGWFGIFFI